MRILKDIQREAYMNKHPISELFSFPIIDDIQVHEYERDEWIIKEGTAPQHLFYILEGKAKIYITHQNGKSSLINFINELEYIGEMELLHEKYYSKGIQTSTRTVCYAIPFYSCRKKMLEDPVFLRNLSLFLSLKATRMSEKYTRSQAFPLENRLAEFILQTAYKNVYKESHVTVCDYLGVSYRHLLYVLAQFCEQGWIQKEGRSYRIIDRNALDKLASILKNE